MSAIGVRQGQHQSVSGAGGSCFYRAIAYQLCQDKHVLYNDSYQISDLRQRVATYLQVHGNEKPLGVRWKDMGTYSSGYAEAPVPQVMAFVIQRPVVIWLNGQSHAYGTQFPGKALHVSLQGLHYSIYYPS